MNKVLAEEISARKREDMQEVQAEMASRSKDAEVEGPKNFGYLYLQHPHPSAVPPAPVRPTRPAKIWPFPTPTPQ